MHGASKPLEQYLTVIDGEMAITTVSKNASRVSIKKVESIIKILEIDMFFKSASISREICYHVRVLLSKIWMTIIFIQNVN